jgi:hypothetical protein
MLLHTAIKIDVWKRQCSGMVFQVIQETLNGKNANENHWQIHVCSTRGMTPEEWYDGNFLCGGYTLLFGLKTKIDWYKRGVSQD